jgi:hypothetical protein
MGVSRVERPAWTGVGPSRRGPPSYQTSLSAAAAVIEKGLRPAEVFWGTESVTAAQLSRLSHQLDFGAGERRS